MTLEGATLWIFAAARSDVTLPTLVGFGGWLPVLRADHWQADLALLINVGVVDLRFEGDLGGLERIFSRKYDLNPECSFVIWGVVL